MIHPPSFIHRVHDLLERTAGALADGRRHLAGLGIQRFRGFCGLELLDTSLEVHLLGLLVWGELGALGDQRLVLLRRRLQLGSDIGRRILQGDALAQLVECVPDVAAYLLATATVGLVISGRGAITRGAVALFLGGYAVFVGAVLWRRRLAWSLDARRGKSCVCGGTRLSTPVEERVVCLTRL